MSTLRPDCGSPIRLDIQGLRAIAVLLVVLYHAGVPLLPGGYIGVDVFFVISGFLITVGIMRRAEDAGTVDLIDFYARRARRILPAALTAIAGAILLTIVFLPNSRWDSIATDAAYSALFVVNWRLVDGATDYLMQDEAGGPLQHFWSLAIEEQFYLLWPVVIAVAFVVTRRIPRLSFGSRPGAPVVSVRSLVLCAATFLTVASLGRSLYITLADPAGAYFSTAARIHELGIGVLIALLSSQLARMPRRLAIAMGWIGLATILVASLAFGPATPFPGVAALMPTMGAAAVIVSGLAAPSTASVGSLLSARPLAWIGNLSFSLYLWHWPLIVVADFLVDGLTAGVGLAAAALSFLPAWLSYRYIERPAQGWRYVNIPTRAVQVGLSATLAVTTAMFTWSATSSLRESRDAAVAASIKHEYEQGLNSAGTGASGRLLLGAEVLSADVQRALATDQRRIVPSPQTAVTDNPPSYQDGCHEGATGAAATACVYGSDRADLTIALVGDSHAAQWLPTLLPLAEENQWQIHSYTKSSCPMTAGTITLEDTEYVSCHSWNARLREELVDLRPDLVLTSSFHYESATTAPMSQGLADSWSALGSAGIPYIVLLDPPSPGFHMAECVERNASVAERCDFAPAQGGDSGRDAQEAALRLVPDAHAIDLQSQICPDGTCRAVIGDVLVYRDKTHLTATYATTLAPALGDALRNAGISLAVHGR